MIKPGFHLLSGLLAFGSLAIRAAQVLAEAAPANPKILAHDGDPHLVAWWKLDESTGKVAADASAGRHQAALEGGLSFETHSAPGKMGAALKLEGQKQCLRATGFKGITGQGPRTLAAWIKTSTTTGEIMTWGHDDFGRMWTFGFIRGRIGVTPKGGYFYMKAAVNDNAWHHVAVVVAAASPPNLHDHVKLFLDGELAEIDDIGKLDLWPIDTGETLDVRIGWRFQGLLDDLRLYDRPLSESEIKSLYQTTASPAGK